MSTDRVIKIIFRIGKVFSLTPGSFEETCKRINISRKIYIFFTIILTTLAYLVSNYFRVPLYENFIQIKLIISILIHLVMYLFTIKAVVDANFRKKKLWYHLIANLRSTDGTDQKLSTKRFWIAQITYWIASFYAIYVWNDILGLDFYTQCLVDVVLMYHQFFFTSVLIVLSKMVLLRYQHLRKLLHQQLAACKARTGNKISQDVLKVLAHHLVVLKETVDIFNDLFGWPILLIIFDASTLSMDYLDDIFKNSYGYSKSQYFGVIFSNIFAIFLSLVGVVILILSYDGIVREARKILDGCYNLKKFLILKERQDISELADLVVTYFPNFSAAGFFRIQKSTIFHIIGTVVTYVIVMVQFNVEES